MLLPAVNTGADIIGSGFSTLLAPGVYRVSADTQVRVGLNTDGVTPPSATDAILAAGSSEAFEVTPGRYLAVLSASPASIVNYVIYPS